MVRLTRIYTKTGDRGTTALGHGKRIAKDHPRIAAYGTVDELNSVLGLVLNAGIDAESAGLLRTVQNDLFDLGADMCVPETPRRPSEASRRRGGRQSAPLRLTAAHVQPLEAAIDRLNATLPPLTSFVLPGGSLASAWLHLARTVCRRAERLTVSLARRERLNPQTIVYLNRLSDLLFVPARRADATGHPEMLWKPGGTIQPD